MPAEENMPELPEIKKELKKLLVKELSLDDITPDDIDDNEILFDEGLGLDSLDAVEIAVLVQRKFGVNMGDIEEKREIFYSVDTLSRFIYASKKGEF